MKARHKYPVKPCFIGLSGMSCPPSSDRVQGGYKMTVTHDKRSDKRIACKIPIPVQISFFDSKNSIKAQLMDHCLNGISFISDQAFYLGSAIIFKVAYCTFNNTGNSDLESLPSIRIGEVRWCRKLADEPSTAYGVGVRYFPQIY